jgi:hypothetical protein
MGSGGKNPHGTLLLQNQGGAVLGLVPNEKYSDIPKHANKGSVRSIRRAPGGGDIQLILIRLDTVLSPSTVTGTSTNPPCRPILRRIQLWCGRLCVSISD